jgi:hypothetical protein
VSESNNNIKQFVEKTPGCTNQTLACPNQQYTEMRDNNELAQIKIWSKPKKMLVNGAMTTVNTISSFKIVSLSNKIDELYTALVNKVQACTTETQQRYLFGNNKMFIERPVAALAKRACQCLRLRLLPNNCERLRFVFC